jgi:maleate isomerase
MTKLKTRPRRIGILLPSSNTVMEPETVALLPADGSVTAHFARFRMITVSADERSRRQFEIEPMVAAAELLADIRPEAILWGGTAASWLGFDHDSAFCAAVTVRTGVPCFGAVQIINCILRRLDARRIGLVTPYVATLESRIVANYSAVGIETVSAERCNETDNTAFADVTPDTIAGMTRRVAATEPDAIVVMCTNLRGASAADELSESLGIPIIDSVRSVILELVERGVEAATA